jgi:hypothetical protein
MLWRRRLCLFLTRSGFVVGEQNCLCQCWMPDFDKEKLVVGTDSGELMYFEGGEVRLARAKCAVDVLGFAHDAHRESKKSATTDNRRAVWCAC